MKKLIIVTLILALLLPAMAMADLPDISGLSFDELVQLRDQLNLAIWNSEDWQEVKVPIGAWKIGEDIPVGKWTITAADGSIYVQLCDKVAAGGMEADISNSRFYYSTEILPKDSMDETEPKQLDVDAYKGNYIIIKYGPAIITPYAGKPDLGFK